MVSCLKKTKKKRKKDAVAVADVLVAGRFSLDADVTAIKTRFNFPFQYMSARTLPA